MLSVLIILFAFPLPSILHPSLSCSVSSKAKPCRSPRGEWFASRFDQASEKRVEDGKREMWGTGPCPLPFSTDSLAAASFLCNHPAEAGRPSPHISSSLWVQKLYILPLRSFYCCLSRCHSFLTLLPSDNTTAGSSVLCESESCSVVSNSVTL